MKKINVLLMPTDVCNMNCVYCFHNNYHVKQGRMTLETLQRIYDVIFASYSDVTMIWHGGEPLIMGEAFFRDAIEMQKSYPGVHIVNRMQSNVTLMTETLAQFLFDKNVSIGTSFDGVENDVLRGETNRILAGREEVIKSGGSCGFIMVLSKKNIDTLIQSYELFKEMKVNYNINTYVSTTAINNDELELNPTYSSGRITEFFDYWVNDNTCNIHVDLFERLIRYFRTGEKRVCKYNSCLGKWVGIRYNGDIMPCNRFFPDEYKFGNVWEIEKLDEAFESKGFELLLRQAIERRYKCQKCEIFSYCSGGCNNVALNENGVTNNGGVTCIITKNIFLYVKHWMEINIYGKDSWYRDIKNPMIKKMLLETSRKRGDNNGGVHRDVHIDNI